LEDGRPFVRTISVEEARQNFVELIESTHRTGESIVIEREDAPLAALVSASDLLELKRLREQERRIQEFRHTLAPASEDDADLGPTEEEEEIVRAVKATREAIYQERYGRG
jgi:prevent-host-death family protein